MTNEKGTLQPLFGIGRILPLMGGGYKVGAVASRPDRWAAKVLVECGTWPPTCQVFDWPEQKDTCAPGCFSAMMELSLVFAAFFDNGAV